MIPGIDLFAKVAGIAVPGTSPLGLFLICLALLALIVGAIFAGQRLRKGRKQ